MRPNIHKVHIVSLFTIALAIGSCTERPKTTDAEGDVRATEPQVTAQSSPNSLATINFDPLGLPGEKQLPPDLVARVNQLTAMATADNAGDVQTNTDNAPTQAYDTYRIQIYNTRSYREASLEHKIAREIFARKLSLDYEPPYFKVRIGDFEDQKSAEVFLKERVEPAGYSESWVTRVRVLPQRVNVFGAPMRAFFDSLKASIALDSVTYDSSSVDSASADTSNHNE